MKLDPSSLLCSPPTEQEAAKMAEAVKAKEKPVEAKNYKGFVAGVFSGIAKLSGKQNQVFSTHKAKIFLLIAHTDKM